MKKLRLILFFFVCINTGVQAQTLSSVMAETARRLWPDSFALPGDKIAKWRYDQGVVLKGIEKVWYATGNGDWFRYIQQSMDFYVDASGNIRGYRPEEYNIDHINNGRILLSLFRVTGQQRYRKAIEQLRNQLRHHPRTGEGGFWHKKIYPGQMWLDGLYMAEPFYAEYAQLFGEDSAFTDIVRQFELMEAHSRNPESGLLYHGWDERREQQWANKQTGQSPNFWGRSLGWFGMALVDVLDYFPKDHPGRARLLDILNRFVTAVAAVQDPASGLWYDLVDKPLEPGNYKEASASCMLAYTFAKASRLKYIPGHYARLAAKSYAGIQKAFVRISNGKAVLRGTVAVSGLGGKPYRDGSVAYYLNEPVIDNDPKGLGAFLLCASEMEIQASLKLGADKTVLLDRWFNSEKRRNAAGKPDYWHYTWEEKSHPGFSLLGHLFERNGATLASLDKAPDKQALGQAAIYIIVDPDNPKDNPHPNGMTAADAQVIRDWVMAGGVLLLMANDSANCDLGKFNLLAGQFGIRFTNKSRNMVKNDSFEMGAVFPQKNNPVFGNRKLYLKEIATLELQPPAKAIARKSGEDLIAVAPLGKGCVLAMGDPWIYNEYLDGRKQLPGFENYAAAKAMVTWLLKEHR